MSANQISKVQERETLEQIMNLIQAIGGDDSYIGMAMKGVYEVAISNIENDFGDSLADQVKAAHARAEKHSKESEKYKAEAEEASREADAFMQLHNESQTVIANIQEELNKLRYDNVELIRMRQAAQIQAGTLELELRSSKQEIIELKAKLYDLMSKESAQ